MKQLVKTASQLSWLAVLLLLPAAASARTAARKRRLLDRQTGFASIRDLPWKRFEELLAEAFRRRGYAVVENPGVGADGGIDLRLRRDGNLYLVQCKQWRAGKVGVNVAREMLGLVTAHGAHGAIIVTSGLFTQEAHSFAANAPIDLIEGQALLELIRSVQRTPGAPADPVSLADPTVAGPSVSQVCRSCGAPMVMREARRGAHAGSKFWGCSRFPNCRHTEPVEAS